MKKVLSIVLCLMLLLGTVAVGGNGVTQALDALSVKASAAQISSGICGDNLTWTLEDDGTFTVSGTGNMYNYSSSPAVPWNSYSAEIRTVIIDNGVESIGDYAFDGCYNITCVTIPDSVTSIGNYAFGYCESLADITIPDSVTSIGEDAFFACADLSNLTIPDSVANIGVGAFSACTGLTGISVDADNSDYSSENGVLFNKDKTKLIQYPTGKTEVSYSIPDSVTSIGDEAFSWCTGLTSVTIPDSVTSIGDGTFGFCTGLTGIIIPDSVTSIGESAFYACIGLTSITIPDSVTSIGEDAFSWCIGLTSVIIPDSVTSIGNYAFTYCISLTSVTIPDSVTSIGNYAFTYCISLTSVTVGSRVEAIGDNAFELHADEEYLSYLQESYDYAIANGQGLYDGLPVEIIKALIDHPDSSLTDVYYTGTEEDWNAITIGVKNEDLLNATVHFNYNPNFDLVQAKESAKAEIDTLANGKSDEVKALAETAKRNIDAATSADEVNTAKQNGIDAINAQIKKENDDAAVRDAEQAAKALADAKEAAKAEIDKAVPADASDAVKALAETAKKNIDAATKIDEVNAAKKNGIDAINSYLAGERAAAPVIDGFGIVNSSKGTLNADYKSTVIFHTTAKAPDGYKTVWSNGQEGDECKFTAIKSEYKISAKLVNISTGETVQTTEEVTVKVSTGFIARIIAFFKSLFGTPPKYVDGQKV